MNVETARHDWPCAQEERDSFTKLLIGRGFTDAWRQQYPEVTGYTYWNFRFNTRANNKGWRLDYFLVGLLLTHAHQAALSPMFLLFCAVVLTLCTRTYA